MNCFLKFTASYTLNCQFNTNHNKEVTEYLKMFRFL